MTLPNSSSALVWQIVKKTNAFAVRGRTGDRPRFSRERGNLMALHSFKHSGLANEKTVDVTAAPGGAGVAIRVSRPKNASKPSKATSTSVSKKTSPRRVAAAAGKAAASLRPDLKRAAAAKASALMRASRARKASAAAGGAVAVADE